MRSWLVLLLIGLPFASHADDPDLNWVLALSWQPAFCESVKHNRPECWNVQENDLTGRQFTLHGLWPMNQNYCNISNKLKETDRQRKWEQLPELDLTAETAAKLDRMMPGRQSHLDRHEWIKHGTCSGLDAEGYYRLSLKLVRQSLDLHTTALLQEKLGKTISYARLCQALIRDFGAKAPEAVRVKQKKQQGRYFLTEIQISLSTGPDGSLDLAQQDLFPGRSLKCDGRSLFIDPPGR